MRHFSHSCRFLACMAVLVAADRLSAAPQYVITISVDGLGSSYLKTLVDAGSLPNFAYLQTAGAGTLNARDDYDWTVTLPNHITMVTGRGVEGPSGHNWSDNGEPPSNTTLHSHKGSYVASVFDVAHDNGLRTAMYATKTKFSLFDTSYNSVNGALDATGPVDNGRDKIDTFVYNSSSNSITNAFTAAMKSSNPYQYSFLHFTDGDSAGHSSGWGGTAYNAAIQNVDGCLGSILQTINSTASLKDKTVVIVTADHGGAGTNHGDAEERLNYTIPLYVWGSGVQAGADLYALNTGVRLDPGTGRPAYSDAIQPIRSGEAANLALDLLGLGPIPGSTLGTAQNLVVPEPSTAVLLLLFGLGLVWRAARRGYSR